MPIYSKDNADWFSESLYADVEQSFRIKKIIIEKQTKYQDLIIFSTERFGKILALDGIIQLTELDEYFYHEAMAHTPLLQNKNSEKILIIGGGDGGILREVVKHKDVKEIVKIEIDEDVINLTKEHIPTVSNGSFDDPRLKLITQDAFEVLNDYVGYFDVVIVDSTDPIGPAEKLFESPFYEKVFSSLNNSGTAIFQSGSLLLQPHENENMKKILTNIGFNKSVTCKMTNATYYGGYFCLVLAQKGDLYNNMMDIKDIYKAKSLSTKWYTEDTFESLQKI